MRPERPTIVESTASTAAFGEVLRGYILADAVQAVIVQGVSVDNTVNEADKKIQAIYKKHGFI